MEFALGRIYAKFYICQIINSLSYIEMKTKQLEFQQLIEDNMADLEMNTDNGDNTTISHNLSNDITKMDVDVSKNNSEIKNSNINTTQSQAKNKPSNSMSTLNYLSSIESNPHYKRYFVYKNIIYSKVEIQGIVVEKRLLGYEEKNNLRSLVYVDDTTGVIQAISWKNKNDSVFNKIEKDVSPGNFIRILGQIDNFLNSFEVIIEYVEIVKNFNTELLFHQTLQRNQTAINESDIFNLLNLENNIYRELNDKKKYAHQKKDFANRIVAFFQRYSIENEVVKDGFIELNLNKLFNIRNFNQMMDEFCTENKIDDKERFFRECFTLLEEHSLGKIINQETVEIKIDDSRIKEEILNLIKSSPNGKTYIEIFDELSTIFNNFFMNDYIKFILGQLVDACEVMSESNKYYKM